VALAGPLRHGETSLIGIWSCAGSRCKKVAFNPRREVPMATKKLATKVVKNPPVTKATADEAARAAKTYDAVRKAEKRERVLRTAPIVAIEVLQNSSRVGERPSEQAMDDTAQVAVMINGQLTLTAAVVREAKALQQAKKALETDLEALAARLKAREQAIISALDAGLPVEAGCPAVAVERQERITPKWKDEAILLVKAAGRNVEVYEAEVRARTPVTVVTRLVINGDVKGGK